MLNSSSKNLTWNAMSALAPAQGDPEGLLSAFWVSVCLFMKWGWAEAGWANNLFGVFPDLAFGAKLTPQYIVRNSFGFLPENEDLGGLETRSM